MIFETFEKKTAAASECGLVWHTADCCRWGDWQMETTYPGLWPCKGTSFWTFVIIMDAACSLLTFLRWIVKHFMTFVVSCYSNAEVRYFVTHCKTTAGQLTWYSVLLKLASYMREHWTLETLCRFCVPKIVDSDQYLLKLFKNMAGVRFFNHSVETLAVFIVVWPWALTFWHSGQCMLSHCHRVYVY